MKDHLAELVRDARDTLQATNLAREYLAIVRLPGLLHELGLSGQAEQALSIKIEVDTRPPT